MFLLNRRMKDSFNGHFLFLGYYSCIRRISSLEKAIKRLKRKENVEAENFFKKLCNIILQVSST